MGRLSTTKMSSRGQIVIPEEIRDKMGLHSGDQFLVVAEKDVVILKAITQPNVDEYRDLIKKTRQAAKSAGLTPDGLKNAIKTSRKK